MRAAIFCSVLILALSACHSGSNNSKKFSGVWVNSSVQSAETPFQIADRILIESKTDSIFQVSILARGIFTEMRYVPEKNYICADNNACFGLKDDNTLLVGTEQGTTTEYKRSKE
ncbi:MAG: hypothetical protein Q4D63_01990 [Neisseria animaloris]|nr:hypothetical protein [Neisseria animaloris]